MCLYFKNRIFTFLYLVFACGIVTYTVYFIFGLLYLFYNIVYIINTSIILGGYCVGVPPLPIPNREVKPDCADGTAMQCGRVGSCLFLNSPDYESSQGFFVVFIYRYSTYLDVNYIYRTVAT